MSVLLGRHLRVLTISKSGGERCPSPRRTSAYAPDFRPRVDPVGAVDARAIAKHIHNPVEANQKRTRLKRHPRDDWRRGRLRVVRELCFGRLPRCLDVWNGGSLKDTPPGRARAFAGRPAGRGEDGRGYS